LILQISSDCQQVCYRWFKDLARRRGNEVAGQPGAAKRAENIGCHGGAAIGVDVGAMPDWEVDAL